jgi:hypothetical protein
MMDGNGDAHSLTLYALHLSCQWGSTFVLPPGVIRGSIVKSQGVEPYAGAMMSQPNASLSTITNGSAYFVASYHIPLLPGTAISRLTVSVDASPTVPAGKLKVLAQNNRTGAWEPVDLNSGGEVKNAGDCMDSGGNLLVKTEVDGSNIAIAMNITANCTQK